MTDYRDINHPGLNHSRTDAYRSAQTSTSTSGILIALALIGLVFLALSLFFTSTSGERPVAPVIDQSTSQSVPAPATEPKPAPVTE